MFPEVQAARGEFLKTPNRFLNPSNAQELVAVIRAEIQYLTTQMKSFEHRISELEATLTKDTQ